MSHEKRRARRVLLNVPTVVQPLAPADVSMHPNLERVYERVMPNERAIGQKFPAVVRDISINGAFIVGEALPLLTRVAFSFQLKGYGQVDALGWSLWRREEDCEVPGPNDTILILPMGFGVLFEAIPLDARIAIHKYVAAAS
ncbi:hypothetical protein [Haliangium sp.]|uniref:hypothetical protein n=1 Tax=Haliangium sp. TaxID=2663208 RepID=UPI003D11AF34